MAATHKRALSIRLLLLFPGRKELICFSDMDWRERIVSGPQILRGKPCIRGTRIPAALILGYFAAGREREEILREFPDLTAADLAACLQYARALAEFESVPA